MPFDAVQGTFGEAAPQGPFDLVVLHSSLHRAVNFTSTLARIRSLLTPGGLLLAVERYPDWSTDFIEGLNPRGGIPTRKPHLSDRFPLCFRPAHGDTSSKGMVSADA